MVDTVIVGLSALRFVYVVTFRSGILFGGDMDGVERECAYCNLVVAVIR